MQQPSSSENSTSPVSPQQTRLEAERMQDVVLLVDGLLRQEEATLGLIVDCLYDIGSVRLIHKKLQSQSLQGVSKTVARFSRPVFRLLALRWIRKNCPELLGKWLYSKVIFEDEPAPPPQPETSSETVGPVTAMLENPNPVEAIAEQSSPPMPEPVQTAIETGSSPTEAADPPKPDITAAAVPPPPTSVEPAALEPAVAAPLPRVSLEDYNRAIAQLKFQDGQIQKLRTRSQVLTGALIVVSVALGGALFWPVYAPELGIPSNAGPVQSHD